jgi:RHH-type proline utilization regulon transcriptional repressor/proline dehydrogenase/delta 1-pyrroline-5-carboxylate dehydrogenase
LRRAADLYEENFGAIFALLPAKPARRWPTPCRELREAVDFLRYYAAEARPTPAQPPRGVITCISPWNFPLAIFSGQIAAALVAGNAVLAKPAEQTPLIAAFAVRCCTRRAFRRGAAIAARRWGHVSARRSPLTRALRACVFTGSTETARRSQGDGRTSAPGAPLIAETGGLNAMIVDSTALPEQAVRDIVSARPSRGGPALLGAALPLRAGRHRAAFRRDALWRDGRTDARRSVALATDVGPVIDPRPSADRAPMSRKPARSRLLHQLSAAPRAAAFVAPAVLKVGGIEDLERGDLRPGPACRDLQGR